MALDTHVPIGRRGLLAAAVATVVALSLLVPSLAVTTSAATPSCSVKNNDTGKVYRRLYWAVKQARPGHHLFVTGTCAAAPSSSGTFAPFLSIDKDLVIRGRTTKRTGIATINSRHGTRVVSVEPGVHLRLLNLVVRHATPGTGAGIRNSGTLTLRNVRVRDNNAGVWNVGRSTVSLRGWTRIQRNKVGISGGRVTLNDGSTVRNNSGDGIGNAFVVTMNDKSTVRLNHAGISDWENGSRAMRLTLNHHSSIRNNVYGVFFGVRNGAVTMNDAGAIHHNGPSGGLNVARGTSLDGVICGPGAGANVRNNTNWDCNLR